MLNITLYGKPGCCLCDKAEAMIKELSPTYPLSLQKIDITTDAKLFELYQYEIPVVKINGEVKFKGKVAQLWLEREFSKACEK